MLSTDTFLHKVRQKNKPLSFVIILFIALTLTTNFLRNEITPFFTWSMYAGKTPATDTFQAFVLEYNDGQIFNEPHTWKDHKRMMFFYTIDYYSSLRDNNWQEPDKIKTENILTKMHLSAMAFPKVFNTDADMAAYPQWLKRYMQANMGIKIDSIKVYRKWMKFGNERHVVPVKSELILKA